MFESKAKRYVTRGISERVPLHIQFLCWHLIDEAVKKKDMEIDYLQIFEFKRSSNQEKITVIHRQEQPEFKRNVEVAITSDLLGFKELKLWVIDDTTHQTMLLPEEY